MELPEEGLAWVPPSLQLLHDQREGILAFSPVSLRAVGDVGPGSS